MATHRCLYPIALAALVTGGAPHAQVRTQTEVANTQGRAAAQASTQLGTTDRIEAEIWGLTDEEMTRAKLLLQGPRAAFSVPGISPIEALGIHARNDAERQRYAEMFAKAFYIDVQRTIAFGNAFQAAVSRLAGNTPMVSYEGMPKVAAPIGTADMANVPRTQIIEPGATGPSSRARFAPSLVQPGASALRAAGGQPR
nr:hypothetical protein [Variovorax boronicumulans]